MSTLADEIKTLTRAEAERVKVMPVGIAATAPEAPYEVGEAKPWLIDPITGGLKVTHSSASIDETAGVQATAPAPFPSLTFANGNSSVPSQFKARGSASAVIKAGPGKLYSFSCSNRNSEARWIQIHNTASAPEAAAVPELSFRVPPNGQTFIGSDWLTAMGDGYSTGITAAVSTDEATYVAATGGDHDIQARFV